VPRAEVLNVFLICGFRQEPATLGSAKSKANLQCMRMVARFLLGSTHQDGENTPNDHKIYQSAKIYQMGIKYPNIFHSKAFQNITKVGFLVC
jgi:hypothetical protein